MTATNPLWITAPGTLTDAECAVFDALVLTPTKPVSRDEIAHRTVRRWVDGGAIVRPRDVDRVAMSMQRKFEAWNGRRSPQNVWGVGYQWQADESAAVAQEDKR